MLLEKPRLGTRSQRPGAPLCPQPGVPGFREGLLIPSVPSSRPSPHHSPCAWTPALCHHRSQGPWHQFFGRPQSGQCPEPEAGILGFYSLGSSVCCLDTGAGPDSAEHFPHQPRTSPRQVGRMVRTHFLFGSSFKFPFGKKEKKSKKLTLGPCHTLHNSRYRIILPGSAQDPSSGPR